MPPRLTLLLSAIITAVGITRCDHQVRYRQIPFPVQRYFQLLPAWDSPQKIEVDYRHHRIYWLSKQGEIKAIKADGSGEILVNKGIGAHLGVTYISDFTIDDQANVLYFTDLMDISTGLSAVKKSDINGNQIETVTTFSDEAPYAIQWDKSSKQLYYATQQKNTQLYSLYRSGEPTPFLTTADKVGDISDILTTCTDQSEVPMIADRLPIRK